MREVEVVPLATRSGRDRLLEVVVYKRLGLGLRL